MININIYGSCVSRDSLEYQQERKIQVVNYFARQSVISAVTPPVPINEDDLSIASQ